VAGLGGGCGNGRALAAVRSASDVGDLIGELVGGVVERLSQLLYGVEELVGLRHSFLSGSGRAGRRGAIRCGGGQGGVAGLDLRLRQSAALVGLPRRCP